MGGRGAGSGIRRPEKPKIGDTLLIKSWFRGKIDIPYYAIPPYDGKIIAETEKAYKMELYTESLDGEHDLKFTRYVPKSATETKAEREKEEKRQERRYEAGKKKYEKMLAFAKQNGVKGVRSGMRKDTILEKIRKAGLKYKY